MTDIRRNEDEVEVTEKRINAVDVDSNAIRRHGFRLGAHVPIEGDESHPIEASDRVVRPHEIEEGHAVVGTEADIHETGFASEAFGGCASVMAWEGETATVPSEAVSGAGFDWVNHELWVAIVDGDFRLVDSNRATQSRGTVLAFRRLYEDTMMATTHALWGMALALPVVATAPEFAPVALLAGLIGGFAPDLDLYAGHRKTLHFPVYGTMATIVAVALALLSPSAVTVALAVGLAAAALHAVSDAFGSGLELRPWNGTSEKAVYSHYHDRWVRPRRLVRYDGAPEDLGLASIAAVPLIALGDGLTALIALGFVGVSAAYVLLRKWLADLAEQLVSLLPAPIHPYVPARYREG